MADIFERLVSAVLNVMNTETSWEQTKTFAAQVTAGKGFTPNTTPPVFSLHEEMLLKILSFLSVEDLLRFSRVSRMCYRLSLDRSLWKNVDLRSFTARLKNPEKLELLIFKRFSSKIQCLDLSGFTMSEGTLNALAISCKQLRVLKLKSVTFITDSNGKIQRDYLEQSAIFPGKLNCLDIRFSQGHPSVFRGIASNLSKVESLGLCDAFLYTLLEDGVLEETIESMKHLHVLDLSHCRLLKENTLALFARCSKLEVLSLRRCPMLTGSSIQEFLESCTHLKTLTLDGISIDDETLQSIRWESTFLTHLELGWCPLITPIGLKLTLRRVSKMPSLEYLGLCSIGGGKALDDEILLEMVASILKGQYGKLAELNLSCSWHITEDCLNRLRPLVETLETTNCPTANGFPMKYDKNNNIEHNTRKISKGKCISSRFSEFEWCLETPL